MIPLALPAGQHACNPGIVSRGVNIISDRRIAPMVSLVDEAGHNKDEHRKVHHRGDYLLVAAEERAGGAEPRNDLISLQYPKRAQDAPKAQTFANYGREEGYDCRNVRPSGWVSKFPHRMRTYIKVGREIGEN